MTAVVTGPPLYGVVGRAKGSVAGFAYSDGMKAKGGTWTYELEPGADGCRVRLTENGSIPNPLIRFMARMMMDNSQYINLHLKALAEHFGESPRID